MQFYILTREWKDQEKKDLVKNTYIKVFTYIIKYNYLIFLLFLLILNIVIFKEFNKNVIGHF